MKETNLMIINCSFNYFNTQNSSSLFQINSSNITISEINFQNLFGSSIVFELLNLNFAIFEKSSFQNIVCLSNDFIIMKENLSLLKIKDCLFRNITASKIILDLSVNIRTMIFENIMFSKNFAKNNIYIQSSENLIFLNVTCFSNNNRQIEKGGDYENFTLGEACFMIRNSFSKNFTNLKIIKCFSNQTAAGLIIVDDEESKKIWFLKEFYNLSIINSTFQDNYCFVNNNTLYPGASLYVDTKAIFLINNCHFKNNLMEMFPSEAMIVGGPCLNCVNSYLITILKSIFKNNKSTKLSNCLNIFSETLLINSSFFINNSVPSLSRDFIEYKRVTRLWYDSLEMPPLFSHLSKGGCVYFSGLFLEVTMSSFYGNVAEFGSVIYFDEIYSDIRFVAKIIIKISNCFFFYQDALQESAIIYLTNPNIKVELYIAYCFFKENYAYNGMVMNSIYSETIYVENNIFFNNTANCGPVFLFGAGLNRLYSSNNIVLENWPLARVLEAGGSYIASTTNVIVHLFKDKFIKNYCYDGINGFFGSHFTDYGSLYLNNVGLKSPGGVHMSLAYSLINSSIFLNNKGIERGLFIVDDYSEMILDNITIKNTTSNSKGSFLYVGSFSKIKISNSFFFDNADFSQSLFFAVEIKEPIIIENSFFFSSSFLNVAFDIISSEIILFNCSFINIMGGILLSDPQSVIHIQNNNFFNISSMKNEIFCLEFCKNFSFFNSNISNFNSLYGKVFFLMINNTNSFIQNAFIKDVQAQGLKLSSIIYGYFSIIQVERSYFYSYGSNAVYLLDSSFCIYSSFFDNSNETNSQLNEKMSIYGTIYLENLFNSIVDNCLFLNNKFSEKGGAISAYSNSNEISFLSITNCLFKANQVLFEGGALFLYNVKAFISNTSFKLNKAFNGGAIKFFSKTGIFLLLYFFLFIF